MSGPALFDCGVTVCSHANERCPVFTGQAKAVHVGL